MVKQRDTHHVQYLNVKIVFDSIGAGDRKSTGGLPRGEAARHHICLQICLRAKLRDQQDHGQAPRRVSNHPRPKLNINQNGNQMSTLLNGQFFLIFQVK